MFLQFYKLGRISRSTRSSIALLNRKGLQDIQAASDFAGSQPLPPNPGSTSAHYGANGFYTSGDVQVQSLKGPWNQFVGS